MIHVSRDQGVHIKGTSSEILNDIANVVAELVRNTDDLATPADKDAYLYDALRLIYVSVSGTVCGKDGVQQ